MRPPAFQQQNDILCSHSRSFHTNQRLKHFQMLHLWLLFSFSYQTMSRFHFCQQSTDSRRFLLTLWCFEIWRGVEGNDEAMTGSSKGLAAIPRYPFTWRQPPFTRVGVDHQIYSRRQMYKSERETLTTWQIVESTMDELAKLVQLVLLG